MDSVIIAAIITASGGILSNIIGKILDDRLKRSEAGGKKTKTWLDTIPVFLLGIAIGLAMGAYFCQPKDLPVETSPPTEITENTSAMPTENVTISATEPEAEAPYILPGTIKRFGRYEQNDQEEDGAEDIEWIALKQKGNEVLIISVLGLELRPYAQSKDTSDWEHSSIREWLNGAFYYNAFSEDEKANIIKKDIFQHKNEDYPHCNQGKNTSDNVFLLSLWEYAEYVQNNGNIESKYQKGTPSTYVAKNRNADLSNDKYSWWWLRTSSKDNTTACRVTAYGVQDSGYKDINSVGGMIRPAMWVDATWWSELQS